MVKYPNDEVNEYTPRESRSANPDSDRTVANMPKLLKEFQIFLLIIILKY